MTQLSPPQQRLWDALHDPAHWSMEETVDTWKLRHRNGTRLDVQRDEHPRDPHEQQWLHTIMCLDSFLEDEDILDPDCLEEHLINLGARAPMSLALWQEALATVVKNRETQVAGMLKSLLLRLDACAQGAWSAHYRSDTNRLVFAPRGGSFADDTTPTSISVPDWMNTGDIPMVRWLHAASNVEGVVYLEQDICADLDMDMSGHQRFDAIERLAHAPDIQDPASAAYWGLNS